MSITNPKHRYVILAIFSGLLLIGLTWGCYQYAQDNPGGNDFLPRWLGTQLYIREGLSPYSQSTTQAIQIKILGRLAQPGEDQQLFVYPFYSIVVFLPYALINDYSTARALWMVTIIISALGISIGGIRLANWRPSKINLIIYIFFCLLWYPSIRSLINGNCAIISAAMAIFSLCLVQNKKDIPAGILLGLSSFKPQMVVLLIPLVFWWSIFEKRWKLMISTLLTLVLLIGLSSLIEPGWLLQNLDQIIAYPGYTPPATPGAVLNEWLPGTGKLIGWVMTGALTLVLIIEMWNVRGKPFYSFFWCACITLLISKLIGIRVGTEHYMDLIPGMTLVFALVEKKIPRYGQWLTFFILIGFLIGLWVLFLATVSQGSSPMQSPVMFFPYPLFLFIGLYMIRHQSFSLNK